MVLLSHCNTSSLITITNKTLITFTVLMTPYQLNNILRTFSYYQYKIIMIFLSIISCSVRLEPRNGRSLAYKSVLVEIYFPKFWHTDNVSVLSLDDKKPIVVLCC